MKFLHNKELLTSQDFIPSIIVPSCIWFLRDTRWKKQYVASTLRVKRVQEH